MTNNEEEGRRMTRNVFEQQSGGKKEEKHVLSHDAIQGNRRRCSEEWFAEGSRRGVCASSMASRTSMFSSRMLVLVTDTPEFDQSEDRVGFRCH